MTQSSEPDNREWDYTTPRNGRVHHWDQHSDTTGAGTSTEANRAWAGLLRAQMPHQIISDKTKAHLASAVRHLDELELTTNPLPDDAQRHIVQLRLSLMEEVFDILRLDRYANAPANEGWMNRFRSWANSPVFDDYFPALSAFSTQPFVQFVKNTLISRERVETVKVAHPWDADAPNASFLSAATVRSANARSTPNRDAAADDGAM